MNIGLFPNLEKIETIIAAKSIAEYLAARGVTVFAEDSIAKDLQVYPLSKAKSAEIAYLISLGGDGTIIQLFHRYPDIQAPTMAINMGHLGFMADIKSNEIYSSLDLLLKGQCQIHHRLSLQGKSQENSHFALNDIVVHRGTNLNLIDYTVHIDDKYLNTFSADGIIFSTPCGSTAYSLAAGGPIVMPALEAIVITPICPHTISNRPIVVMPSSELRIEFEHMGVDIAFDGCKFQDMSRSTSLTITRSKKYFQFAHLPTYDFYATLRSKLGWTGKVRLT